MPMHDWTRVPAGIFHAFHHGWVSALCDAMNSRVLPHDHYALPEQIWGGPDLYEVRIEDEGDFYRRKKSAIAVRHVSGDRVVAFIEIVSPGNKANAAGIEAFVKKAAGLLGEGIHLLVLDPFPPGPRDPDGIHALIWNGLEPTDFHLPPGKPLTLVSYECDRTTRAYIEPVAVGDPLPDMPLFLEPNGCVTVPVEATYNAAFAEQPRRWRDVLQPPR